MTTYDITRPLQNGMAVWPGDTPYQLQRVWRKEEGESVNVGSISLTLHAGSHADAPYHFQSDGTTAEQFDLSVFVGPAVVVFVPADATLDATFLQNANLPPDVPRLLFRTDLWQDNTLFPTKFPLLTEDGIAYLTQRGTLLLGFDIPSVDDIDSKDLPNHHALANANIQVLESLILTAVPPGTYELIALPLCIVGGDAAPLRAILRSLQETS